ncbi:MAG: leucine-rich repeat domain-containing protein [Oscillospiraceae bacterium]|nr:leucine-rich repeat domain-containing protein [Oscillospiraceae bacterium]
MNFKKTISFVTGIMTAFLCVSSLPAVCESKIIISDEYDFSYSVNNDGNICLEKYTGEDEEVIIPDEIDGKPVIKLNEVFLDTNVSSITLNKSIESINANAFLDCYSLKEINVPDSNSHFQSDEGVLFTEDMKILLCYPSAKSGDSYEIPEGVTDINVASIYSTQLKHIKFPSTLSYIDRHGISYNEKLEDVDLSNTVITGMGDMAFAGNVALKEVKFPDNLYEIGGGAFAACKSLKEITFPPYLSIIGQNAFAGTGLTEITIPESVSEIGYSAFGYDENLEPIDSFIIRGVTGSVAQSYATESDEEYGYANNFTFISTDGAEYEQLDGIPYGDFEYAEKNGEAYITSCNDKLSEVEIPAEINGLPVTVIYGMAFYQSEAETVKLPDTLKRIEIMAFAECDFITNIDIPEGTEEIMAQAFYQCDALKSVNIPSTCTEIGSNAFAGCSKLSEINIAEGNSTYKSVEGVLFNADATELIKYPDGKADSYKIPANVISVADYAFSENENIVNIDLNNVESIGTDSFSFCKNLKTVKMNDKLKKIGLYAFYECEVLEKVKLSSAIEEIEAYAFYQCPSLKSIRIGNNITKIDNLAFGYTYNENDGTDVKIDDFKIYADKDSGGAMYAETAELECISGTILLGNINIDKIFLIVMVCIAGVVIISATAVLIIKSKKKKE